MESRILVDTNILLDYLMKREPFYPYAKEILILCKTEKVQGCIAAHSVSNIFYILRKYYSLRERRVILTGLCSIFEVIGIDKDKLIKSLENENFTDFEDCLQMECAKEFGAEYIVTRNTDDYKTSAVPAVSPKEYLERF